MSWLHGVCDCCVPEGIPCGICTPPMTRIVVTITGFTPVIQPLCTSVGSFCGGTGPHFVNHQYSIEGVNGTYILENQAIGTFSCEFLSFEEMGFNSCSRTLLTPDLGLSCPDFCSGYNGDPVSKRLRFRVSTSGGFIGVNVLDIWTVKSGFFEHLCCHSPSGNTQKYRYDVVEEVGVALCNPTVGTPPVTIADFCAGAPYSWVCTGVFSGNPCQNPYPVASTTPYTITVQKG